MPAKLKHIALVSDNYALQGKFYEAAFGMRTAADPRPERAVTVSDGYVGLNINPRKPGRPAGLDHFGLEVDELEPVLARLRRYPEVQVVGRPSTRPFAGLSTHDPAGNVFDLSQRDMANRVAFAATFGSECFAGEHAAAERGAEQPQIRRGAGQRIVRR